MDLIWGPRAELALPQIIHAGIVGWRGGCWMMLGECGGSCSRAGDAPHFGAKSGHLSASGRGFISHRGWVGGEGGGTGGAAPV